MKYNIVYTNGPESDFFTDTLEELTLEAVGEALMSAWGLDIYSGGYLIFTELSMNNVAVLTIRYADSSTYYVISKV
jgi:hypothetical protein